MAHRLAVLVAVALCIGWPGAARADHVEIAVVAYGPGINMFRKDRSQVLDGLERLEKSAGKSVTYTACSNTMKVERPAIIGANGRSGGEAARGVSAGR